MNLIRQRILLLSALVVSLLGYNLWLFLWKGFFYQAMALFVLMLLYLIKCISKDYWVNKIAVIGCWMALNNLLDELFFNPTEYGYNDYIILIIVIFVTLKHPKENGQRKR